MNVMKQDSMDDKIKERCKTCEKQCMQEDLGILRSCRAAIKQKPTSMDRESIEDLSSRQRVSRWIVNLSGSYQDKFSKTSMGWDCDNSCLERRSRGSIDSLVVERYREAIEKCKK